MNEKNSNYTRKCVVTNQILDISNLIRFDFNKKNNKITLDWLKNKKGRGCYLKNDPTLWDKFKKTKALNRAFRINISNETYLEIEKELMEVLWLKNKTE